ncbi:MAG: hypothetical protein ACLGIG_05840 [Actinomycetes bacterium]
MTVLLVALTVAVALMALLVVGLLHSHAEILRQLHELGAGRDEARPAATDPPFAVREGVVQPVEVTQVTGQGAHDVAGTTPGEEAVALSVVGVPHRTLLAFLSSGCSTCETFWDVFGAGSETGLPDSVRLVVVTKGPEHESETAVRGLAGGDRVPVVMSTRAWESYGVPGSPYFVLVDGPAGRVVGEGSAGEWAQVVRLVGEAEDDSRLATRRTRALDSGNGAHREARADRELLDAGIAPGHHSLYATADEAIDVAPVDDDRRASLTDAPRSR